MFLHDFGIESRFSFVILILQTTRFTAYLHDLGTKSRFSFGDPDPSKKRMFQMSTKAFNPRCKINFGNLTFRVLILQTTWFTANLHDFGTKSRFSFGILILQTSPTDATVAIIMHCSHGQKNYGNMSIENLSPLSGNKILEMVQCQEAPLHGKKYTEIYLQRVTPLPKRFVIQVITDF